MTIEEKLAAIEASLILVSSSGPRGPFYESHVDHEKIRWLIAEVRRLQSLCTTGRAIIHDIADGSEYRRGREDERAGIVDSCEQAIARMKSLMPSITDPVSRARLETAIDIYGNLVMKVGETVIERGEHVAEQ